MKNVKDALLRMYEAYGIANKYGKAMEPYENPMTDVADMIADAVYHLIGEKTETYDESVTCQVLNNKDLSEDRAIHMLMNAWVRNVSPEQPAPNTMEPDKFREMAKHCAGYHYETPEGDWT